MQLNFNEFKSPPAEWRSVPFWSLNDELDPAEIERQLAAFKQGGFGGSYLHSRIGLLTEYLGADWWKAMDAGVRASKALGIEAWFYDEDKWPSGFAGGLVPSMSEDFHARFLLRLEKDAPRPVHSELLAEDGAFQYLCVKNEMGDPWFNGTCWVDLMNPATVKAFIDLSYVPYAKRYAEEIGRTVKGIFTDEPQVSPRPPKGTHRGVLPYSPCIRATFKQVNGRDLAEVVASLFEDTGDFPKVRTDYFRTIARQFEASFSKQIGDYCEKTGLVWTGHFNAEESSRSVQINVGNMMAHYRHMQRPGIDHLGLHLSGVLNAMKSLSSVANQYARSRRLSEMFGISGQNMNFEDRAWIADCHAVLGINHICPHLSLYSLKGCRKRDYPPTLSPQQPYWSHNRIVEDRMARVSYLSSVGEYAPELLVIHPLESAFIDYPNGDAKRTVGDERFKKFNHVLETLTAYHRDYDLGDEEILADIGTIEDGELRVGAMRYRAALLPPLRTIRKRTVALLAALRNAGGRVFAIGDLPEFIDGIKDSATLAALDAIVTRLPEEFGDTLEKALPAAIRVDGDGSRDVWTMRRAAANGSLVMLFNRSRLKTAEVSLSGAELGDHPLIWDPNGACLSVVPSGGSLALSLAPAVSLFVTTGVLSTMATVTGAYAKWSPGKTITRLDGLWQAHRLDPNAITLDFARYSTDDGKSFSSSEPVIGIHDRLTRDNYNGSLLLAYEVNIDKVPLHCELVLEQPEMYRAAMVNGQPVKFGADTYRDLSFRKTAVSKHLKQGINTILLSLDYVAPIPASRNARERYGSEIESIYLIGEFGVAAERSPEPARSKRNERGDLPVRPVHRLRNFRLVGESTTVSGDLAPQGYPFYAGSFRLSRSFAFSNVDKGKRYFLVFPETEAIIITVSVNGRELPPIAWSPWEVEITDALCSGENTIAINLTNSLRNLLGPHHHTGGKLITVGPVSFTGDTSWTDNDGGEGDWYERRLTGQTAKWVDDYYHIGFGLLAPPVIEERS